MKIKLILKKFVFALGYLGLSLNLYAADWAEGMKVGDAWPGLKAADHQAETWAPETGKAHLYIFSRSIVW